MTYTSYWQICEEVIEDVLELSLLFFLRGGYSNFLYFYEIPCTCPIFLPPFVQP